MISSPALPASVLRWTESIWPLIYRLVLLDRDLPRRYRQRQRHARLRAPFSLPLAPSPAAPSRALVKHAALTEAQPLFALSVLRALCGGGSGPSER